MSIATRINAIEEHIGNAYDKLEDLGIDLTNIDKNINNIASLLDTVYEDYPKVQGQGTEVTLDGTKAGKLTLDVKGNSTQDGTPAPETEVPIYSAGDGKDIFTNPITLNAYISATGVISSSNEDRTVYVKCNSNTEYIIKKMLSVPTTSNRLRIGTSTSIPAIGTQLNDFIRYDSGNTITEQEITTSANANYLVIFLYNTSSTTTLTEMLNSIKITEKVGSISEKIVNKNWFDKNIGPTPNRRLSTSTGNPYTSNGYSVAQMIEIFPNAVYTLTTGITSQMCWYDKNQTRISGTNWADGTSKTSPANAKYLRFDFQSDNIANVQLELGSTATTYVAHQEQTYTIPVQQPMRSIGEVRDEFIQVNGNWFERHNIVQILLDGSGAWVKSSGYSTNEYLCAYLVLEDIVKNSLTMSNKLVYGKYTTTSTKECLGSIDQSLNMKILVSRLNDNSIEGLKNWLSLNNIIAQYIASTPQDLPCTEEQIAILENLPKSYNEQTNIYSLDVTPAYIETKALKGE